MHTRTMSRALALSLTAGLAVVTTQSHAQQIETVWTGIVDFDWNEPGNWTAGVPDNGAMTFSATINSGAPVLDINPEVDRLFIEPGSSLSFPNGRILSVVASATPSSLPGGAGVLDVRGTIFLNGSVSLTGIRIQEPGLLEIGSATTPGLIMTIDDTVNSIGGGTEPDQTVVFLDALTYMGSGLIGRGETAIENRGQIIANQMSDLTIDPGDSNLLTNSGLLRAENGATMNITGADVINTGGMIQAAAGSEVQYTIQTSVTGGTLDSVGGGVHRMMSNPLTLDGVTTTAGASIVQNNGALVQVRNGLVHNGDWFVDGSVSSTRIRFEGTQSLTGSGTIEFRDDNVNRLELGDNADTLTVGPGVTLRGAPDLMDNAGGVVVNQGTILAEGVFATIIDPGGFAPSAFVNQGTVMALGPGGLRLNPGLFVNTGETVQVGPGSQLVVFQGVVLEGGTLASDPAGVIEIRSSDLVGITLASGSNVFTPNGSLVTVTNALTNNTSWLIDGSVSTTGVLVRDGVTLAGSGEILLRDDNVNRVAPFSIGGSFTNGPAHTIRGAGFLLANSGGMINEGAVIAEGDFALTIDPSSNEPFVNMGDVIASGSGGMIFNAGTYINTGQTLMVLDGSTLRLNNNAELVGGVIDTDGSGVLVAANGSSYEGVTVSEDSFVQQPNGSNATILGGLTNNGLWNLDGSVSSTTIDFDGDQTLGGTGSITTRDDNVNRIVTSDTVTQTNGHDIIGNGDLLFNSGSFVNFGGVYATGASDLNINPGPTGAFTNFGVVGGDGTLDFIDDFSNDGVIAPGIPDSATPVATLTIKGDVFNASSAAHLIQIVGPSSADRIDTNGAYTIDGQILVSLTNGFEPTDAGPYTIIDADSISGTFTNAPVMMGSVSTGVQTNNARYDVIYDAANGMVMIDNVELFIPPCSPADLASDGMLNFADVSAFLSAFALGSPEVDFDNSGTLDFGDVSAFLALFAAGCP